MTGCRAVLRRSTATATAELIDSCRRRISAALSLAHFATAKPNHSTQGLTSKKNHPTSIKNDATHTGVTIRLTAVRALK